MIASSATGNIKNPMPTSFFVFASIPFIPKWIVKITIPINTAKHTMDKTAIIITYQLLAVSFMIVGMQSTEQSVELALYYNQL